MYFITGLNPDSSKCVGYMKNLEKAVNIVENNDYNLNEDGRYPYIVIENIPEGLYQYDFEPIFFKWNSIQHKYIKTNLTPDFIHWPNIGFAIG